MELFRPIGDSLLVSAQFSNFLKINSIKFSIFIFLFT